MQDQGITTRLVPSSGQLRKGTCLRGRDKGGAGSGQQGLRRHKLGPMKKGHGAAAEASSSRRRQATGFSRRLLGWLLRQRR
jgi:hypothetical protein